jgi:hypothetical protein
MTRTPSPAKSELRRGRSPPSFFNSVALFSATSFAIAKSGAISDCRSGRAATSGVQFAAAAVQPPLCEPYGVPSSNRARFIDVRMWKTARSSAVAHSAPLTAGIGG